MDTSQNSTTRVGQQDILPDAIKQRHLSSAATQPGDMYYGLDGNSLTRIGIGTSSQILTVTAGIPSWQTLVIPPPVIPTDGWTATTAAWTYASATTFTVVGDQTAVFSKGTRLRFTQTSVKYAVVISSAFSSVTTVTIAQNTDYTLANTALSVMSYSYAASPQGYPGTFAYTPTLTTGTGTVTTQTTTGNFRILGKTCTLFVFITLTTNGTGATDFRITLPNNLAADTANYSGWGADNNAADLYALMVNLGVLSTSQIDVRKYDSSYPGVSGRIYQIGICFDF